MHQHEILSPFFKNCAKLILDRAFKDTGSHIGTMYKDLGITMSLARQAGAAMFTTSAAYEMFQAGISRFPDEDNWAIVKWLEEIKSDSDQLNGVLIIMFIISGIILVIIALYIMIRNWNSNSDSEYTCKQ